MRDVFLGLGLVILGLASYFLSRVTNIKPHRHLPAYFISLFTVSLPILAWLGIQKSLGNIRLEGSAFLGVPINLILAFIILPFVSLYLWGFIKKMVADRQIVSWLPFVIIGAICGVSVLILIVSLDSYLRVAAITSLAASVILIMSKLVFSLRFWAYQVALAGILAVVALVINISASGVFVWASFLIAYSFFNLFLLSFDWFDKRSLSPEVDDVSPPTSPPPLDNTTLKKPTSTKRNEKPVAERAAATSAVIKNPTIKSPLLPKTAKKTLKRELKLERNKDRKGREKTKVPNQSIFASIYNGNGNNNRHIFVIKRRGKSKNDDMPEFNDDFKMPDFGASFKKNNIELLNKKFAEDAPLPKNEVLEYAKKTKLNLEAPSKSESRSLTKFIDQANQEVTVKANNLTGKVKRVSLKLFNQNLESIQTPLKKYFLKPGVEKVKVITTNEQNAKSAQKVAEHKVKVKRPKKNQKKLKNALDAEIKKRRLKSSKKTRQLTRKDLAKKRPSQLSAKKIVKSDNLK